MYQREVVDDLEQLLEILPPPIRGELEAQDARPHLIEVVLDLGRRPEARYPGGFVYLSDEPVTADDLSYVLERVGQFGPDNRAGIERTLHRISAIRNRSGQIVGITCRIGRAVYGTLDIVRDVVESDRSVLFVGRPGIGKTTMLREFARVLADDLNKRVIIVDTSNEIGGDGDIPHPAIGRARRMQVPRNVPQADVMIEAVENHMPEVIVIDEIGTSAEANAARTIAERGVRLIGTAHGNTLENLILNPTLCDLVGGFQAVTLGDEEAKRRGTQKTVLERKAPPTFDILVEIEEKDRLSICFDVAKAVDAVLRGGEPEREGRRRAPDGSVEVFRPEPRDRVAGEKGAAQVNGEPRRAGWPREDEPGRALRVFPYAVSRNRLERAIRESRAPVIVVKSLHDADMVLTLKGQYRKMPKRLREAEQRGLPVHLVRSNTYHQIAGFIDGIMHGGVDGEGGIEVGEASWPPGEDLL